MLVQPKMEDLLPKAENRYTLALLVAKRARQLVDGARHMVDTESPNLVTIACEELVEGQFRGIKGIRSVYIPLRPEIEAARLAARAAAEQASLAEAIRETVDSAADESVELSEPDPDLFQTEFIERAAGQAARSENDDSDEIDETGGQTEDEPSDPSEEWPAEQTDEQSDESEELA